MIEVLSQPILTAFVVAVLANTTPLLLAAIGEAVGEQAGVLNLGIEGILLVGGYFGFVGALSAGSFWWGFLCGAVAGAVLSSVLMILCIWMRLNQIVVGIGLILAGTGVSGLLYNYAFANSKPRVGIEPWPIPLLSDIPVVGPAIFAQPGMLYLALLIPVLVSLWLYRTMPGLRLRVAGQSPASLDAAGGNVSGIRSLAVIFGGAMSGLGGAYLALVSAGTFTPGMTHGLGFLAIVVAMLARGSLARLVVIALIYGVFVAAGSVLQLTTAVIPNDVVTMMPFIVVLIVLVCVPKSTRVLPPALATAYVRGERG